MCGTVTFARCRGAWGFNEHDLRLARTISKQTGLALERATRFEATGQRIGVLQDVLDHLPQGIVVSSADGETIFVNSVAASRQSCGSLARKRPAYGVDAPFALFLRHGRGIHAVSPRHGRGSGTQQKPRQPQHHPRTPSDPRPERTTWPGHNPGVKVR